MWISEKTLDAMQTAVIARDKQLAAVAQEQCARLREILKSVSEDARFQALPVRHPFKPGTTSESCLAAYGQASSQVLEWLALSGAISALLRHEIALRWLRVHRPSELAQMRELLEQTRR